MNNTYIRSNRVHIQAYTDAPAYLNEYLRHIVVAIGYSIKTANTYYVNIRLFLRYIKMLRDTIAMEDYDSITIEDVTLSDLSMVTKEDVDQYIEFLNGRGDAVSTRSHKVGAVKTFYDYLREEKKLDVNPFDSIKRPKTPKMDPKYLQLGEAKALLRAAAHKPFTSRDLCMTVLLLHTGMRLSELLSIDVANVKHLIEKQEPNDSEKDEKQLAFETLEEETEPDPEEFNKAITITGKGKKQRTVYLDSSCVKAINRWIKDRDKITNLEKEKALFVSPRTKRRLTARRVEKIIENELVAAGLGGRGFSPHKLRHTCATLLYNYSNADVLELKELLGHEHIQTTEIYTHLNNQRLREVTENNPLNTLT